MFASSHMKGKQPYWPGTLWRYYAKPALKRAGIVKHVSYHTFRHTSGTLLNANGENPKVVQELLRHASLKGHDRRLHAGRWVPEAPGAKQFSQTCEERLRYGSQVRLSGSTWIMKKNGDFVEVLYFVGVLDGI